MKTELLTDSIIDIQRYLRRKNARLIRAIPRNHVDARGRNVDAWVVMYIEGR